MHDVRRIRKLKSPITTCKASRKRNIKSDGTEGAHDDDLSIRKHITEKHCVPQGIS
ncbi:hypothetical protein CTI12_AA479950 [Artemisia annua]|uniref:Uncharacterized protein n=1 Tax=Artemisia annua TaxID=35608 RepID=A0A2U1LKV5_ARTAN|nr:hypothetical protein CTI12_AA479950 [Artemisia annua]